ncbi:MAG: hypothetical protein JSR33_12750 [Proteobacteria bacterium]|nr:hypothetical protein [Pseudomonadota bacterium]
MLKFFGNIIMVATLLSLGSIAFAKTNGQSDSTYQACIQLQHSDSEKFDHLIKNPKKWDAVLDKISTGRSSCLALAAKIKPYTDAANSESLNLAVALAMPKNPNGVLSLVHDHFTLEEVCTVPYIEADDKLVKQYLKVTIHALSSRSLTNKLASSCLKILKPLYEKSV